MSIKLNDGTILRNLEEQVQYLTNYHDVNQGLVQWGIRVVGRVDNESQLPDPATYNGEYGDAIAVGLKSPFFFYIWTRASIEGDPAYWFPFGEISIVGPVGPVGPIGPKGDVGESTKIVSFSGIGTPPPLDNSNIGDYALNTQNGDMYQLVEGPNNLKYWKLVVNIKGPQGIQGIQGVQGPVGPIGPVGPKGDTGDVGGFINIWGILSNSTQLPSPASLNNLTVAYLVGTTTPYDLYVQIGETPDTAVWTNTGPFNAATAVSVNGSYQNIWNADVKADKTDLENYIDKNNFNLKNGTGEYSITGGQSSTASNKYSFAFGWNAKSTGYAGTAFGEITQATGSDSFVAGRNSTASGNQSIALGNNAQAQNTFSVAIGDNVKSTGWGQIAFGSYNNPDVSNALFMVGNGNAEDNRKNAFTVLWDGRAKVQSTPIEDDDVVRFSDLRASIQNSITSVLNTEV